MFEQLIYMFPGIGTMFVQEPIVAFSRLGMMGLGFFLAVLGFKRTLEPLIMVPMGIGMMCVNGGEMFLEAGKIGTLFLDPLIEDPAALVNIMQIDFLQPIYNFTFTNSLVACMRFFGIGAMSDISFILARPWASIVVALFTSLVMAKDLFVPISIIAYLYLSLTHVGYPYLIGWLVPKKYCSLETEFEFPNVSQEAKFIFTIVIAALLCLFLPVAAPLILSFFLGVAIKEAEIEPY